VPDFLVIVLLLIGPLAIWILMRFLKQPASEARIGITHTPPED